ncbi:M28 family peptidase [Chryseobacterium sp. 2TAF14]|uniref:M28 family peptidase n=1 Tax=Chryseobacterium sp. 2TAF14 TaxID=3233007 RepID=UPI003F93F453
MKKLLLPLFSVILLISCGGLKTSTENQNSGQYSSSGNLKSEKAFNKAYQRIKLKDLKKNLYVIASDEMEGRDTGSRGQKKAGEYIIKFYKDLGISFPKKLTSYYQKVPSSYMNKMGGGNLPDSENILAFIEGTEKPEEIIVISAHYDHVGTKNGEVYNGADDDGSGTVAVMQIAKAFQSAKKAGNGPKRSILFLHVTGEEHGLFGSSYYSDNPVFPLENTVADLNIDMIGRDDAHYNFAKHGIPVAFFFDGIHEDYHRPTDDVEKIDFPLLQKRTQLVFATAWELANREARIVVDKK